MVQSMIQTRNPIDVLAENHDNDGVVLQSSGVVATIAKSETEAQLDAAHKYPRSVTKFLREATTLATITQEVAESCIYSLERRKEDGSRGTIDGPSVRLAEICASSYGNLHVGGRIVDVEDSDVVAQGVAWDLEKNLRVSVEVRRRITKRNGTRFSDDMIIVTGNAAASIALRNAIFRVVPRTYVDRVYEQARQVAIGKAETLDAKRTDLLARLQKMGISQERVLARLEKAGVSDIGLDELAILIGLGNAVRNGEQTVDEAFPPVASAPAPASQDGQRVKPAEAAKTEQKPEQAPQQARKGDPVGPPSPPPDRPARRAPPSDTNGNA